MAFIYIDRLTINTNKSHGATHFNYSYKYNTNLAEDRFIQLHTLVLYGYVASSKYAYKHWVLYQMSSENMSSCNGSKSGAHPTPGKFIKISMWGTFFS